MARKLKDKVGALPDAWKPKKLPKKMGECIDLLYQTRAERLSAQRAVDAKQKDETAIKEHLKQAFKWEDLEGARGSIAQCAIVPSDEPVLEDPLAFFAYVAKTKSFDLLIKQVNKEAARLRWNKAEEEHKAKYAKTKNPPKFVAAGVIPGVQKFVNRKMSLTKI